MNEETQKKRHWKAITYLWNKGALATPINGYSMALDVFSFLFNVGPVSMRRYQRSWSRILIHAESSWAEDSPLKKGKHRFLGELLQRENHFVVFVVPCEFLSSVFYRAIRTLALDRFVPSLFCPSSHLVLWCEQLMKIFSLSLFSLFPCSARGLSLRYECERWGGEGSGNADPFVVFLGGNCYKLLVAVPSNAKAWKLKHSAQNSGFGFGSFCKGSGTQTLLRAVHLC